MAAQLSNCQHNANPNVSRANERALVICVHKKKEKNAHLYEQNKHALRLFFFCLCLLFLSSFTSPHSIPLHSHSHFIHHNTTFTAPKAYPANNVPKERTVCGEGTDFVVPLDRKLSHRHQTNQPTNRPTTPVPLSHRTVDSHHLNSHHLNIFHCHLYQ